MIIAPLDCQPSSYAKYTYANMQLSYDVHSVSNTKYIFYICRRLRSSHSSSKNT